MRRLLKFASQIEFKPSQELANDFLLKRTPLTIHALLTPVNINYKSVENLYKNTRVTKL
ncbi:hypothetical protein SAMN05428962_2809 [Paenibacillus sp. BC26]|nr:hypothetical protein SAMN05428962_2809 [Paenibacillus sp. BC26]